jgi:hypothetical protein
VLLRAQRQRAVAVAAAVAAGRGVQSAGESPEACLGRRRVQGGGPGVCLCSRPSALFHVGGTPLSQRRTTVTEGLYTQLHPPRPLPSTPSLPYPPDTHTNTSTYTLHAHVAVTAVVPPALSAGCCSPTSLALAVTDPSGSPPPYPRTPSPHALTMPLHAERPIVRVEHSSMRTIETRNTENLFGLWSGMCPRLHANDHH